MDQLFFFFYIFNNKHTVSCAISKTHCQESATNKGTGLNPTHYFATGKFLSTARRKMIDFALFS